MDIIFGAENTQFLTYSIALVLAVAWFAFDKLNLVVK